METTLYFKDIRNKDQNNYPSKIYKVEYCRMLIEVLDTEHINGRPHYFGSPRLRDDFSSNKIISCVLTLKSFLKSNLIGRKIKLIFIKWKSDYKAQSLFVFNTMQLF